MKEEQIKYYKYLEMLRRSGVTNMYGARPYLEKEFNLTKKQSSEILIDWMYNYNEIEKCLEDAEIVTKREY